MNSNSKLENSFQKDNTHYAKKQIWLAVSLVKAIKRMEWKFENVRKNNQNEINEKMELVLTTQALLRHQPPKADLVFIKLHCISKPVFFLGLDKY